MIEVRDPKRTAVKIWLMFDTRETLKALGSKGESYDTIIRRLIEHHEQSVKVSEDTHRTLITLGWDKESIDATIRRLCDMPEDDEFRKEAEG